MSCLEFLLLLVSKHKEISLTGVSFSNDFCLNYMVVGSLPHESAGD